jgi:hypothetical protein
MQHTAERIIDFNIDGSLNDEPNLGTYF